MTKATSEQSFPESWHDALVGCIKAAGGSKVVGHRLFPDKLVDAAQRHLLNCMDDHRAERLTPDQVVLILRLAREKGCHTGMAYLAHSLGYAPPQPIEPRDETAELQRQFIAATAELGKMAERISALQVQLGQLPVLKAVA